ncbi:MerR family transcriptional regulator [Tsukamurella sputi]|uniref:MerR family transcriptional regulator n=1 Tax=Tsukamurella sputi TaxID=2591848 RepID=A0A5C5RFU8_9ACTN|nr:MerR family transcriptional regulator [Tsukamurella sputi]TWS21826.1 MerR family transcriptional regulator [Tsukamurella sputi]
MRLSELSAETGVSTASLKYYLRESLLRPGETITRTQAEYGPAHVDRVRLIRALVESGGLSLARVRSVLDALDSPTVPRTELLGVAQEALTEGTDFDEDPDWTAAAAAFIEHRGWRIQDGDVLLPQLGAQLKALTETCDVGTTATLDGWADAAERIAATDLETLTGDDAQALRTAIVGTVLSDRVLQTLRRLAQQNRTAMLFAARAGAAQGEGALSETTRAGAAAPDDSDQ